jgi:lipoyl-dependent peroxiredoxin
MGGLNLIYEKFIAEKGQIWTIMVIYTQSINDVNIYGGNIMAIRNAEAVWQGSLKGGKGTMKLGSGAYEGAYSFSSRFEEGTGTNPEELIGAAHAGCYSMALSADLGRAGFTPTRIVTRAQVTLGQVDGKSRITLIHLETEAVVPGVSADEFQKIAEGTKTGCPVSAALAATPITLTARLV